MLVSAWLSCLSYLCSFVVLQETQLLNILWKVRFNSLKIMRRRGKKERCRCSCMAAKLCMACTIFQLITAQHGKVCCPKSQTFFSYGLCFTEANNVGLFSQLSGLKWKGRDLNLSVATSHNHWVQPNHWSVSSQLRALLWLQYTAKPHHVSNSCATHCHLLAPSLTSLMPFNLISPCCSTHLWKRDLNRSIFTLVKNSFSSGLSAPADHSTKM